MDTRALVSLVAICFPLPCIISLMGIADAGSLYGSLVLPAIVFGAPALALFSAVRYGQRAGVLSRPYLLRGAATFGLLTGLIIIIPLAYPLIVYPAQGTDEVENLSRLIGILASLTALSLLYAYTYWWVALRPEPNAGSSVEHSS